MPTYGIMRDRIINGDEECDDGNTFGNDGCNENCEFEPDNAEVDCNDGIKGDFEEGIDCGGLCEFTCDGIVDVGKLDGETTDLSDINQDTEINELTFEDTRYGKIIFQKPVVVEVGRNFKNIKFGPSKITINSEKLPELNEEAMISFTEVFLNSPVVYRDGTECTECEIISYDQNMITFKVPGFTTYTLEEEIITEYCGDSSCNNGETCNTCPSDCGACSGGGSSGGGGGGGTYQPTKSIIETNYEDEKNVSSSNNLTSDNLGVYGQETKINEEKSQVGDGIILRISEQQESDDIRDKSGFIITVLVIVLFLVGVEVILGKKMYLITKGFLASRNLKFF